MKKTILITILALFAFNAYASDLKLGHVDLNKALNSSDAGKKAVKILEDMVRAKQTFIDQKGEEIKDLDEELVKQSSVLNPEALKEKREVREKLMREYQRMVKDSQQDIQKKQADLMENIIKELKNVVRMIGKEEGYLVVFERSESGIIYIPENVDLTDKLIKRFNEISKK